MNTKSKSKTFQKDEDCLHEMLDWVINQLDTHEDEIPYNPGSLTPPDPVTRLNHKYIITVTRVTE